MRKPVVISIALALAAAPVAFATPDTNPAPPRPVHPTAPTHPVKSSPPVKVAFIVRGLVTAADASAGTVTVQVRGTNRHARRAFHGVPAPVTIVVSLDATTRIRKAGMGAAGIADVVVNDRVIVAWKAPRATTAAQLAALVARRVVDRGPKPAPAPAP